MDMRVYVGYDSARSFWRAAGSEDALMREGRRAASLTRCATTAMQFRAAPLAQAGIGEPPYHVIIFDQNKRCIKEGYRFHVCTRRLPAGSFICIGKEIYLSCPELSFLQMARTLSLPQLVEYGTELCAVYSFDENGTVCPRERPLTSRNKLEKFLDDSQGAPNSTVARKALRWVSDLSVSPLQTRLMSLLCLKPHYGGYSIPLPDEGTLLNVSGGEHGSGTGPLALTWAEQRVELTIYNKASGWTPSIRPDGSIEGTRRLIGAPDSKRRRLRVIELDLSELAAADRFDVRARALGRALKRTMHPRNPKQLKNVAALRAMLDIESYEEAMRSFSSLPMNE
jgi:hypothetical protein